MLFHKGINMTSLMESRSNYSDCSIRVFSTFVCSIRAIKQVMGLQQRQTLQIATEGAQTLLTEQLLFTTPKEELKASWDYSSHHSS